ncbi:hypothetical protein FQN55_006475 [Onygenales sp. PD_40]|nr:hypothetical protein FQN55_006475 [Onygenales sp. PD_40]
MLARPFRALLLCIFILSAFVSFHVFRRISAPPPAVLPTTLQALGLQARQIDFWKALLPILQAHAPGCPSPKQDEKTGAIPFDAADPPRRPALVSMPDADLLKMQQAHANVLEELKSSAELQPVVVPKSRGVVSTAGGSYLPVFVSSLRMLRRTGSKLPVELFLKDRGEYESNICDHIIPSLNGRCIVLSDILHPPSATDDVKKPHPPPSTAKGAIEHYQLKIFAMLFSSFEEILFLDADCFPLHKPELLFDAPPYKNTGMVTWPDFWISTVSSQYYNITQRPIPSIGLRASSETGQILVSKKTHHTTLLLAAYYNYYGPSHYFSLLSQGAPGEGDKETFLQAAEAADEPFYAVRTPVTPIGHSKKGGGVAGSAMVQFDPVHDYQNTQQLSARDSRNNPQARFGTGNLHARIAPHADDSSSSGGSGISASASASTLPPPRAFFIHAHFPKFNPATVFDINFETRPTYKADGSDGRAWVVPQDTLARFGYDVERAYWEEILWMSCEVKGGFKSWEAAEDKGKGICARVRKYWGNVFGGENGEVDEVSGIWDVRGRGG